MYATYILLLMLSKDMKHHYLSREFIGHLSGVVLWIPTAHLGRGHNITHHPDLTHTGFDTE